MKGLIIGLWICFITLISCANPKPQNNLKTVTNNGLSAAERAVGWRSLFNGTDMSQWRVYREEGIRGWQVAEGKMTALGLKGNSADIISIDTFSNMELSLEWNISEGGNSGIFFNVREGEDYGAVYYTGPEYQLLDDDSYEGKITALQQTGANYDMEAPSINVRKPAGSWNTSRIIVNNGVVEHWLNGKQIVKYEIGSQQWNEQRATSKWKDVASYAQYSSGHLALQDHGAQISFRDIKVRRL